jgi:hypothetical protein
MKNILLFFTIITLLASCEVEGDLTRDVVPTVVGNESVLKYSGTFVPTGGITVQGDVKIYIENNSHYLKLNNFDISSGPDLKVYLSKTDSPSEFVNLGNLNSNATYTIPLQVNLDDYPYVLIHCQQYNHLFAIAALQSN